MLNTKLPVSCEGPGGAEGTRDSESQRPAFKPWSRTPTCLFRAPFPGFLKRGSSRPGGCGDNSTGFQTQSLHLPAPSKQKLGLVFPRCSAHRLPGDCLGRGLGHSSHSQCSSGGPATCEIKHTAHGETAKVQVGRRATKPWFLRGVGGTPSSLPPGERSKPRAGGPVGMAPELGGGGQVLKAERQGA